MRSHDIIYRSKLPNYKGVRIPVNSNINIEFIRENLKKYFDEEIVQYLEFGWPIGVTGEPPNKTRVQNHAGARNFPEFIDSYIIKEIQHKAILGPYEENPFESNIFVSPLNSVPKEGNSRRIIVDLSFPESESVNSRLPKETYLDDPVVLKYPNVYSLVQIVRSVGKGALMFKRELQSLLSQWLTKSYASKKEVQSLIRKLNFVATCVRPSRVFLSRMLNFLRQMEHDKCPISSEFQKDVFWWLTFLRVYNGVSMIPWQEWSLPDEMCAVDACLVGCGGTFENYFFHSSFPEFIREQNLHINCLEL